MAVQINAVGFPNHLLSLTPTYPLIEGEQTGVTFTSGYAPRIKQTTPSSVAGGPFKRIGARITLPAPLNLSGYDWLSVCQDSTTYGTAQYISSLETGGVRIIYIDGTGNYAGFNLYGAIDGYSGDNQSGYMTSYTAGLMTFHIAANRVPDITSGVIDWSNIVAYEFSLNTNGIYSEDLSLFRLVKRNNPSVTGVSNFTDINTAIVAKHSGGVGGPNSDSFDNNFFVTVGKFRQVNAQRSYYVRLGVTIGDGTTPTTFQDSAFSIGFENPYDKFPEFMSTGQWILFGPEHTRPIKIVQSPSDILSLTDASFASSGYWQWLLSGTGIATCTRVSFWRFDGFVSGHGVYNDCEWNEGWSPVEVTLASTISGGTIRDFKTVGLKITSGPGNYSNLTTSVNSLVGTYDVELGQGGAGTYNVQNISSDTTLRIHNNSAVNAVTVKLPIGTSYETTTVGGAISIEVPTVSAVIEAPAIIAGSRVQLMNVTDSVELLNTELVSSGVTFTTSFTGNKIVRLRADHASKLPLEAAGVLTTSGLVFLDVQLEDSVYLLNNIDGSAVSEFTPDGANVQVDISDPDGITDIQRLYAWLQWYMTTEEGIRSSFFGAVSATDSANYSIDQSKADLRLDNVSPMPVRVVGGYLSRKDGSTVIAPNSNSIQMDPGKAYAIETGVSGLTVDESNKLQTISTLNTSVEAVGLNVAQLQVTAGTILDKSTQTLAELSIVSDDVDLLLVGQASSTLAVAGVQTSVDSIHVPTKEVIAYEVWSATEAQDIASGTKLDAVLDESIKIRQLAMNKAVVSEDGLTVVIYADDGVTPLQVFSISDDKRTRVPV